MEEEITTSNVTNDVILLDNRKALASTLQIIATKVNQEEVNHIFQQTNHYVDEKMKEVHEAMVDKSTISTVQEALSALSQKVDLLSQSLSQKVDCSNIQTIKSDVEYIRKYAQFVPETKQNMEQIQTRLKQQSSKIATQEQVLSVLNTNTKDMKHNMEKLVLKSEFDSFQKETNEYISCTKKSLAKQNQVQSLENQLKNCQLQIIKSDEMIQKLQMAHEKLATYTANRFGKIYSKDIIDTKILKLVTLEKFKHCLTELNDKMEERYMQWNEMMGNIVEQINTIESHHEETKKRSLLAAEFIDWYGRKGDAYEHNMCAVDGYLKKFVTNNNDCGISNMIQKNKPYRS